MVPLLLELPTFSPTGERRPPSLEIRGVAPKNRSSEGIEKVTGKTIRAGPGG